MTNETPTPAPDPGPSETSPSRRWGGLLIPAATFLVGLLIGGLVIGVGRSGSSSSSDEEAGSSSSPSPAASSPPAPGDTVVTVPAECQQAADKVREATSLLRSTVSDVQNFKPDKIVETLNRLEDIDAEIRPLLDGCSQVDVTTGATPVPSDSSSSP